MSSTIFFFALFESIKPTFLNECFLFFFFFFLNKKKIKWADGKLRVFCCLGDRASCTKNPFSFIIILYGKGRVGGVVGFLWGTKKTPWRGKKVYFIHFSFFRKT